MHMKNRQSKQQQQANVNYMLVSKSAVLALSLLKMWRANARLCCVLTLTAPVMLLTACAHNPPAPCKEPEPVTMPALSQPLPKQSYSLNAQQSFKRWQGLLTDTSPMPKP